MHIGSNNILRISILTAKLTILGCGSSWGVPVIGCKCTVCRSHKPENKRARSSVLVSDHATNLLIDFGFDIRNQLLKMDVDRLDAAILTHDHGDHVSGIDELRIFKILHNHVPKIYSDHSTIDLITERYRYLFDSGVLEAQKLDFYSSISFGNIKVNLFKQDHRVMDSIGIRIKDTVYTNDVVAYPEESKKYLENAKIWIIDCVDYESTDNHLGLKQVLELHEEFKPKKVYLTNLSHLFDYDELKSQLPKNIEPAYDGLTINIE